VLDRVAAAATDADHLDDGALFRGLLNDFKHGALLSPVRIADVSVVVVLLGTARLLLEIRLEP
jgi:hypothetical protein